MLVAYVNDVSMQILRNQSREVYLALPLNTPDRITMSAAHVRHRVESLMWPRCPNNRGSCRIPKRILEEMHKCAMEVLEWASANSHHAAVSAGVLIAHHTQYWVYEHSLSQEN